MVMVHGPWPAIVTTNWDPFLEVAWKKGSANLEPSKNAHQAWGKDLRVFYRAEIESFHAHLDYFIDQVFNYPTYSEGYRIAALNGMNKIKNSR